MHALMSLYTRCKWAVGKKIMDLVEVISRCKELYLLVGKCCFEPADLIWTDINYYHWQDTWMLGQGVGQCDVSLFII